MRSDLDYPESEVLQSSRALVKPDARIVCRRCPNADWVVEEDEGNEYGPDLTLHAYCAGLGGQWIWPKRQIVACDARIRAIRAERSRDP